MVQHYHSDGQYLDVSTEQKFKVHRLSTLERSCIIHQHPTVAAKIFLRIDRKKYIHHGDGQRLSLKVKGSCTEVGGVLLHHSSATDCSS